MIKQLVINSILFFQLTLISSLVFAAGENIVDANSVSVSGYSNLDGKTIYGGVAGAVAAGCATGTGTCNSCIDSTGIGSNVKPCNQNSIHSNANFTVSFKITKSRSNAIAKLYINNGSTFQDLTPTAVQANYSANSTVTIQVKWSDICNQLGLGTSCTSATDILASAAIVFGVGADNSANLDTDDEVNELYTIKIHVVTSATVSQSYCATSSVGTGSYVCNLSFVPGDQKAYIASAAVYNDESVSTGSGTTTIAKDAIAIFPIPLPANSNSGDETNAYTNFTNGQVSPVFRSIDSANNIPDSQVAGLENYRRYCMVYGTRNKAGNIYKFLTAAGDSVNVIAGGSCITPSEVVGLLDDKSCFISTAAFGSVDAPEVSIFRKFRNQFLLTNNLGKLFVKTYYLISPPIANFISGDEYLKATTRFALYPALAMAYLSLKIGFIMSITLMMSLILGLVSVKKYAFKKK